MTAQLARFRRVLDLTGLGQLLPVAETASGALSSTGFGAELVTNGDFSGGSTGWTANGQPYSGVTISGGQATCSGAAQILTQNVGFVTGQQYRVQIKEACTTNGQNIRLTNDTVNGTNIVGIHSIIAVDSVVRILNYDFTAVGPYLTLEADGAVFSGNIYTVSARQSLSNVPTNEISGTSSLTLSPSATATGLGALSGSSAIVFSDSGTLTGLGVLSGASTLVFTDSGTLTGLGSVTGSSTLVLSPSGTATGLGALTGSAALIFAPSGTTTGLGSLAGGSAITFAPTGSVAGLGALAGATALSLAPFGTLTGLGSLLASTALSFGLGGTLNTASSNEIAGTAALSLAASGALTGLGHLAGSTFFSLTISGQLIVGAFGEVKVRILDEWQAKPVKVWNGTVWVEKPLKYWTGIAWQATGY